MPAEYEFITVGNITDCMTRRDAARYLKVSAPTFSILIAQSKSGKLSPALPALRLRPNGRAFYSKSALDKWLELRLLSRK